jgi:hypothetical protein
MDPDLLLDFLSRLKVYLREPKQIDADEEDHVGSYLSDLIQFLETEYASRLQEVDNLISHGEITFDRMRAIFFPGSIVFSVCPTTSEPRAYRLCDIPRLDIHWLTKERKWILASEYVDADNYIARLKEINLEIKDFESVITIEDLDVHPIEMHPNTQQVQQMLIERGKRWMQLVAGIQHMHYSGIAYRRNGRVAVSRTLFIGRKLN